MLILNSFARWDYRAIPPRYRYSGEGSKIVGRDLEHRFLELVLGEIESGSEGILDVFISSVIGGMEEYRDAAADAIRVLGHNVVRAEDFGASPTTPRIACLDAVRKSDTVVLILGARYGQVQDSGLSATHEEYMEAREARPVLAMIQEGIEFDPKQRDLVDKVQDWNSGNYTQSFSTPSELKDAVTRALHRLTLSQVTGSPDLDEILERAINSLEDEGGYYLSVPRLAVAMASGSRQTVLRPAEMESFTLEQALLKIALFGSVPIFTTEKGTKAKIKNEALMLEQEGCNIWIQEDGTIDLLVDLPRNNTGLNVIIAEHVTEWIEAFLSFAIDALDEIDDTHRLSHSVVVANLLNVRNASWRTRAEHAQNLNTVTYSVGFMSNSKIEPVCLDPPDKPRSALRPSTSDIAEDLTVLLRRQLRD